MAKTRTYEVVVIVDRNSSEEDLAGFPASVAGIIEKQGGTITKSEDMGMRRLAYEIKHQTEGRYFLFEIDGSGQEIAELERRMRVSDAVVRYITVRVDEDRRRAAKFKAKRERKASRRNSGGGGRRNRNDDFNFAAAAATEEETVEA
jgi:small subunit ribosomal protein S6